MVGHSALWSEVSNAVRDFQTDLTENNASDNMTLLVFTEFGRRVHDNGSGTDHGAGGCAFVIGDAVDDPLAQARDQAIGGGATALMFVQSPDQAVNLGQWLAADGVAIRDIASSDYALLQSLQLDRRQPP